MRLASVLRIEPADQDLLFVSRHFVAIPSRDWPTHAFPGPVNPLNGFGAMRLTGEEIWIWGRPKDRNRALAVLRRAAELGVNFIDTADSYGPNISEELIVEALFPYPPGLVVATKGGWNRPDPNQWTHDVTPSHLRKAVEGSDFGSTH